MIPFGQSEWSIGRDNIPLRIGTATIVRDDREIFIKGSVAGVVNGELTIALDPATPGRATVKARDRELEGTLTEPPDGPTVFEAPSHGTVTLTMKADRMYVRIDGFGAGTINGYYLSR